MSLWCYGLVVVVTWLMGVTASARVGVLCALIATPGLVVCPPCAGAKAV